MVVNSIWKNKGEARKDAELRACGVPSSIVSLMQFNLDVHLTSFLHSERGIWGTFNPLNTEVSPKVSVHKNTQIQWAYPRIRGNVLEFYLNPISWLKGSLGLMEPDPKNSQKVSQFDLNGYLVPGLGFDRDGGRLGRGKGFFDRALEGFQGKKVGVAFSYHFFSCELPKENFDITMDLVVTDKGFYLPKRRDRRND